MLDLLGDRPDPGGIGGTFRARDLDRILDQQPAALVAGHRALDEEKAAIEVGADDFEILLGAVLRAHMTGHLLVLEDPARILALPGRAERTVGDGNAVGGAHSAEAPALHSALETLALGRALDVDILAGDEMVGGDLRAHVEQGVLGDDELRDPRLRLHLGLAEMAALRLGDVLHLGGAGAQLERGIAVASRFLAGHDLNVFERQDGDRHVAAVLLEQAGHPHFLRDHASAHDHAPYTEAPQTIRGACQPELDACPAWASAPPQGAKRRGRRPEALLPRYHPVSRGRSPSLQKGRSPLRRPGESRGLSEIGLGAFHPLGSRLSPG